MPPVRRQDSPSDHPSDAEGKEVSGEASVASSRQEFQGVPGNGYHLRNLVAIFLLLALGIGILGWLAYSTEADHLRQREYAQLRAISHFKATQVGDWLEERRWDAKLIFGSSFSRQDLTDLLARRDPAAGARLEARMQSLLANSNYIGAELIDREGRVRLAVGSEGHRSGEITPEILDAVAGGDEPQLLDLHREAIGGAIRLAYLVPIPGPGGDSRSQGFLWIGIDPERILYPLIQSWPVPSASDETLLVRREGNQVLFLNNLRYVEGSALTFTLPMSRTDMPAVQAILGHEGIFEGRDYRGVPVLTYLQPIPGTPWRMVTKVDREEVFEEIRRTGLETFVATLILLFFFGVLLWMSWVRQKLVVTLHMRKELERVADLTPGAIHSFCLRPDGSAFFSYASPAIWNVFGYGRKELAKDAAPMLARIHPDDAQRMQEALQASARNLSPWHAEYRYEHPEKGEIWVEERSLPERLPDGSIVWRGFLSNVTERKRAQLALEGYRDHLEAEVATRTADLLAANQELHAFTYAASHDLKAPLRGIKGFAALLERDFADRLEGDGVLYLQHICHSAARMANLIDDLLAYAQVEQQTRELKDVHLGEAVRAILSERREEIRERRAEMRVDVPPVKVRADPHGLAQVLRNLVDNALKYSAQAALPVVEIGGESSGDYCRLWVRDNGIGFDMAYRDQIFEIFRRLHGAREFPGTGVGLALVRKAMERMGGRVWAESTPGQGATFYLELACAPPAEPSAT